MDEAEEKEAGPRRRRLLPFAILVAGALLAVYFGTRGPREQHLRLVLGSARGRVTGVTVEYDTPAGEPVREARMTFDQAPAPRVVALDPELPDGPYRLRIDLDTREGRRSTERQVTLGGGTTSVDLAGVLRQEKQDSP